MRVAVEGRRWWPIACLCAALWALGCDDDAPEPECRDSSECASGERCLDGACVPGSDAGCATPLSACADACVDVTRDPANCGGCGLACGAGERCAFGACESVCPGGLSSCEGLCRDLRRDPAHCGGCGVTCAAGEVCGDGECASTCPVEQTECGGACVDTLSSLEHCGACDSPCAAGEVCDAGACGPPASCRALQRGDPTLPDGEYVIRPDGAAGAFPVYCDMSTRGGGWTLVWRSFGGPEAVDSTSTLAVWTSTSSGLAAPFVVSGGFASERNVEAWDAFVGREGVEWIKMTRDYDAAGTLVEALEASATGAEGTRELFTPHDVVLSFGAGASMREVVENGTTPCFALGGAVSMTLFQRDEALDYGQTDRLNGFNGDTSIGFASVYAGEPDDCGQPPENLMDDWAARHVISYSHTVGGQNAVRCQFRCWDGLEARTKEVVWGVREP